MSKPGLTRQEQIDLADALSFFGAEALEPSDAPPPPSVPRASLDEPPDWTPDLNPTQQKIFDDPSLYVLGYGEKGSGKTVGFGHKIIRHLYENDNALGMIITPTIRTGNEGMWHDLATLILPAWKEGIGLEFTESKLDPLTKDRHRWIRNAHGGWSKLMLLSIPYSTQVEARVAGPAPSLVYVDELDKTDGEEYYTFPSAQLGRRRGIDGPQQFLASCNPKGPSHWVYKVFWVDHANQETGERDAGFAVYHVPISENKHRLPEGYVERLMALFKNDPTETARLIHGEWIDRPTGSGLLKNFWNAAVHLKGVAQKGTGLRPMRGFPIIIGYDVGQVYSSITLMQRVLAGNKVIWLVFDEVDHLNERVMYRNLALEVIARMRFWVKKVECPFTFVHISDESAINQWRPGEGSYDAWHFEKEFNRVAEEFGNRKMKMVGCPKGAGSVAARVLLLQTKLSQEELFVSATCKNTQETMLHLEEDPKEPSKPKRSKFLHKFDSLTYPIFKYEVSGDNRINFQTDTGVVGLISCGTRI